MNYNNFLNRDYNSLSLRRQRKRFRGRNVQALALVGVLGIAVGLYLGTYYDAGAPKVTGLSEAPTAANPPPAPEALEQAAAAPPEGSGEEGEEDEATAGMDGVGVSTDDQTAQEDEIEEPIAWKTATVRNGDNLSLIFRRVGLGANQLNAVLTADAQNSTLKHLTPGQTLKFHIVGGELQSLRYTDTNTKTLIVERDGDSYVSSFDTKDYETQIKQATATIESSLFLAGQRAGLSDKIIMELAGIFGWDVDFALDLREGDSFAVVYEQYFLDGRKVRDGDILAAEFVSQERPFRALRFTDRSGNTGYYDPNGFNMRKAFLRSPVDFRRISSRFQSERWHPVLGVRRPHKGVDYAAPIGTPIHSAGDGTVTFVGSKGGYGKTVIVQHGSRYSTLYGHISTFRSGVKAGLRVRQGQVIGYVGQSGLATGPHLHYEFRVDGEHRDPLNVKVTYSDPIPRRYKDDFAKHVRTWMTRLDELSSTRMVLNQ